VLIDKGINKATHLFGLLNLIFVENARRIDTVYACAFRRDQIQNPRRNGIALFMRLSIAHKDIFQHRSRNRPLFQ
jgi:hypothetical protein